MPQPLWTPSAAAIQNSQMSQFMRAVNQQHGLALQTYPGLYQWSIERSADFWSLLWKFFDIKYSQPWQSVLTNSHDILEARWFEGARLNYAENLLRHRNDQPALVFRNESGARRVLSYDELYQAVAKFAAALREAGVVANDRVAGFMPNMPESIIAMLATISIGAIWSSCSPDFGIEGVYDRFSQIQPKILISTDGYCYNGKAIDSLEKMQQLLSRVPSIEKWVVVPYLNESPKLDNCEQAINYAEFVRNDATTIQFEQLPFNHPIYVLYSSGTTGVPKCIVHGAGGMLLQHLKELRLHTDLKAQEVIFYYTTCGWMMWNWLVSSLAIGATLVLYDGSPFHPKKPVLFDLVDEENIAVFGTSAKYLASAEKFRLKPIATHQLKSLRSILSTGSPLLPMNFDYVYQQVKTDVQLASISGGTDIASCFAFGNPIMPVYVGELQCRGLGLKVEVYDEAGKSVQQQKGELVCTAPFPAMPVCFWNDADNKKYRAAYFEKFPNVWAHGDYAEITEYGGLIIYGRSDAILNPHGIRIGTAEIYRQVETLPEVLESLVIGQDWQGDVRVVLFVKLQPEAMLTPELQQHIKTVIRANTSHAHVPEKIIQVRDIPKTINGKITELAVREVVHGRPVKNKEVLANPEALAQFENLVELQN